MQAKLSATNSIHKPSYQLQVGKVWTLNFPCIFVKSIGWPSAPVSIPAMDAIASCHIHSRTLLFITFKDACVKF